MFGNVEMKDSIVLVEVVVEGFESQVYLYTNKPSFFGDRLFWGVGGSLNK